MSSLCKALTRLEKLWRCYNIKTMAKDRHIGKVTKCQICGSPKLKPIISFGHHPPCDSLVDQKGLHAPEIFFPLNLVRCLKCGLAQLDYIAPPKLVFHPKYPYRTGITKMLTDNFKELAETLIKKYKLKKGDLIIDIGSNDGTALKPFKARGMRVLGVEPTDICKIARKDGIDTIKAFFTREVARKIAKKYGKAKVIIATNVFAHVAELPSFMQGLKTLLTPGGSFVSESQYLPDTIQKLQYDTVYHEHLRYYSLKPLAFLFKKYGFALADAERIASSGGSIRVFATKGKGRVSPRVRELIKTEEKFGLYNEAAFKRFKKQVETSRFLLVKLLNELKLKGKSVAGVGSPGRSSTIMNYCHLDPALIPYVAEQSTSLKLGLFTPGTHLPVIDEKKLFRDQPDYALIFSWHIGKELMKKLRQKGLKSKFIFPI